MNIWSETPIIDLVLKVEVGCPQNDSVKNGCQGATMGPLLCGDLWILRLGVVVAVDKFFNLAWKIFLGAGSFFFGKFMQIHLFVRFEL